MRSIEGRVRRLEETVEEPEPKLIILFGDDPEPENLSPGTKIIRVNERYRGV